MTPGLCPGSFTPLCLPPLCLPVQCWASLFHKAHCCSRLHLGREAQVSSAPCFQLTAFRSSQTWQVFQNLQWSSFHHLSPFVPSCSQPHRIMISLCIGKTPFGLPTFPPKSTFYSINFIIEIIQVIGSWYSKYRLLKVKLFFLPWISQIHFKSQKSWATHIFLWISFITSLPWSNGCQSLVWMNECMG